MQLARKIGATCSAYVTFSPAANAGWAISSTPPSTAASADIRGWRFISDVSLTDKPGPTPTLGGHSKGGRAPEASVRLSTTIVNKFSCSRIIEQELLRVSRAASSGR